MDEFGTWSDFTSRKSGQKFTVAGRNTQQTIEQLYFDFGANAMLFTIVGNKSRWMEGLWYASKQEFLLARKSIDLGEYEQP